MTKSVLSAVVGLAIGHKHIESVEQPLTDFYPDCSEGTRDLRLVHLLSMTSGCDLNRRGDVLSLTRICEPGTVFEYSDALANLLGRLVTRATGKSAFEFARPLLFEPLELDSVEWRADPHGNSYGAGGLLWNARDMARFGDLFLNAGRWNGEQIVSRDWVRESTRRHSDGGPPLDCPYGYMWWVSEFCGYRAFHAAGYGGQVLAVFPDLRMVVSMTADEDEGRTRGSHEALSEVLLPALIESS